MQPTKVTVSTDLCRQCGWPDTEPYDVVSRHTTSEGVIIYTRCTCGLLHVRRQQLGEAHASIIARSQKAAAPPSGGQQQ